VLNRTQLEPREFIEKAIRFYMDIWSNDSSALLPKETTSAIDGRLGLFEDRMASCFTSSQWRSLDQRDHRHRL
jgi:hypothetical protein